MDTIQIIKINQNQILVTLNTNKTIKLDVKFDNLKNIIRKINHNILDDYVISGYKDNKFNKLQETSHELFNILNFFDFKDFFLELKNNKFNHIQLIVDEYTNCIPFEILHDGKDFLSDYIIFSRLFIDSKRQDENQFLIESNKTFSVVCNPSESDDIMIETNDECNHIAKLINSFFDLRGPYKKRHVNKIELIHLLGISSYFHFSGHYKNDVKKNGWELFDDLFTSSDIQKISKSPEFIFSNTCGGSSEFFINSFLNKGSKSIIASLGNLPSKKAAEFSQIFYKYFIINNFNLGESFFLSKRDMIDHYGKKDLFWCFYQIYGSSSLKINKKNIKKNREKSKPLKLLLFVLILTLFSFLAFDYFKREGNNLEPIPTLKELHIKSNNKIIESFSDIELDTLKAIKSDTGESIYFKLVDNKPIFSLNPYFEGLELFIYDNDNVEMLLDYKQDTLNLNFKNRKVYYNDTFHHIHLDLGVEYKNIEVYIKKIDIDVLDYELFLLDKNNYNRYKIKFSELIDYSRTYGVITINELQAFADPQRAYKYGPFSDIFDLIKDTVKFNKELHLYIKKALLK